MPSNEIVDKFSAYGITTLDVKCVDLPCAHSMTLLLLRKDVGQYSICAFTTEPAEDDQAIVDKFLENQQWGAADNMMDIMKRAIASVRS